MQQTTQNTAPTLLAIALAARKAGDRDLESFARSKLLAEHGVKLTIGKPSVIRMSQTAGSAR